MPSTRYTVATLGSLAAISLLAACSGGGSSAPPAVPQVPLASSPPVATAPIPTKGTATKIGLTLIGRSTPFGQGRHALDVAGTPVVVTYLGATVATGSLDPKGFVSLVFTKPVPAGATIVVTIGTAPNTLVATVPLASAISATAAEVTFNPGPPPTITVKSAEDQAGNGQFQEGNAEEQIENEDAQNGNAMNVEDRDNSTLPANLPISISSCGSTLTVLLNADAPTGKYVLDLEQKVKDGSNNDELETVVNPFTGSVTVPVMSTATRVKIQLFRDGKDILDIKAPLNAATTPGGTVTPAPATCPTLTPLASPSPNATSTANQNQTPSPSPTASSTPKAG